MEEPIQRGRRKTSAGNGTPAAKYPRPPELFFQGEGVSQAGRSVRVGEFFPGEVG
jgi:hypothetical protein